MKNILLCMAALAASVAATATDITDVTAQYLTNPSFELDDVSTLSLNTTSSGTRGYTVASPQGWTLAGTYGVSCLMSEGVTTESDNNFGVPGAASDGTYMYYLRNAWSSGTATLTQSVTLPAGAYRLTVDNKCVTAASHTVSLTAGNSRTALSWQSSMPSAWTTSALDFTLTEQSTLDLGLSVTWVNSSGGSVIVDNFRLYSVPDDYVEPADPQEGDVDSPTEGVITADFVPEAEMMADLLAMIARFSEYMVNDFYDCAATNSINEECGYFNGESSGQANEAGVRTNADLSMLCAFLVKYAKPAGIALPDGVEWDRVEEIAMKSLVFAYSTHKANKLKVCAGSTSYWGSTATSDYVWESSLWAMSVAYSAYFQWEKLTDAQRTYIYNMLKAECNYELNRTIPTGFAADTKAEENGWEADVLAATLGLFPDDDLAQKWYARMREFAVNSYSHHTDATDLTVLDPDRDEVTVADLHAGVNLYPDYTLQNHSLFHTSYQNVVMQELGEAALALQMFQGEGAKWQSNALMHNNQEVMDSVLNWLALTDGELAMPNGNDWSLFLYDQITSYSTQACYQRDPNALMLENLAYKYIKARQQTTDDGAWLLRPDVSARRMGVEGHRVMMTYLMHLWNSTADLTPTAWEDFRAAHSQAKVLPSQNVVRAFTQDRFTTFSWSTGLSSYTGYFAQNCPDKNKIVVPYRANNTGNLIGWYTVSGQSTNATPAVSGVYELDGDAYTMVGELKTNGTTLDNHFALYSTPGNALIYVDYVTALSSGTITGEYGGLLAISTDELTKLKRTLYYQSGDTVSWKQLDGTTLTTLDGDWVNIDNELGVAGRNGKGIAFGDRSANNSIYTSKLYPMYSADSRTFASGDVVDRRHLVYYSSVDAQTTAQLADQLVTLADQLPEGWNGVVAADPDGTQYALIANFCGTESTATVTLPGGRQVTLTLLPNHCKGFAVDEAAEAYTPATLIVNPDFDEGTTGWSGSPTVSYSCAEKWNTTFDVYQTITGLAEGKYLLSCQGFYRCGGYEAAATKCAAGTESLNATLYATTAEQTVSTPLASIFSEAGQAAGVGVSTTLGYVPNTMEQAQFYFQLGLYPNAVEVDVPADGTLTIGVKKTTTVSSDWAIFDTFALTAVEAADDDPVDEEPVVDAVSGVAAPFALSTAYTAGGARATAADRGVLIQGGKKVVR